MSDELRDLDVNVAKLLGWNLVQTDGSYYVARPDGSSPRECRYTPTAETAWQYGPHYSTDGNAMLQLIAAMMGKKWRVVLESYSGRYRCIFYQMEGGSLEKHAPTLPEAVARAALGVLTEETKDA